MTQKETQTLSITLDSRDGENGVFLRDIGYLNNELWYDSLHFIPLDEKTLIFVTEQMEESEDEIVLKTILKLPSYDVPVK